jgi:hypothetical protein
MDNVQNCDSYMNLALVKIRNNNRVKSTAKFPQFFVYR